MIAILSTLFGVFSGILPSLVKIFELKVNHKHELEMLKIQLEANERGIEVRAAADEGKSLREHDASIDAPGWLETLRATIRPVLTYFFFFLFCGIKITAAIVMFSKGINPIEILGAVWDSYTMAIFGSIIGFWFGSRSMMKLYEMGVSNQTRYDISPKKK